VTDEDKQAAEQAKAPRTYAESPVGKAESASERGESFFQIEISVSKLAAVPR
jgi:hypothetical protein